MYIRDTKLAVHVLHTAGVHFSVHKVSDGDIKIIIHHEQSQPKLPLTQQTSQSNWKGWRWREWLSLQNRGAGCWLLELGQPLSLQNLRPEEIVFSPPTGQCMLQEDLIKTERHETKLTFAFMNS